MGYDEQLAARIREAVKGVRGVGEKAMFGGIAWMKGGHMFTGTLKDELMVRVGKDAHDDAVGRPHARIMDFTGKEMRGFIVVAAPGVATVPAVREWALRGLAYAESLPAKTGKKSSTRKPAKRAAKAPKKAPKQATKRTTAKTSKKPRRK